MKYQNPLRNTAVKRLPHQPNQPFAQTPNIPGLITLWEIVTFINGVALT
jgi:hypothetical protein